MNQETRAALAATRTIDLTTVGRRSGAPSRIEIWWFYIDGSFFITGTPGPRDWYANILQDPSVTVHAMGMDLSATAEIIAEPDVRRRVFTHPDTSWYTSQAELQSLIDQAPMVEIRFGSD